MGHFLFAAKAFDVLERLDPDPEYWEGKRGACVGVFQMVIAGKASKEDLQDALSMIRNTSNPQVGQANFLLLYVPSPENKMIWFLWYKNRWSTSRASSRSGARTTTSRSTR